MSFDENGKGKERVIATLERNWKAEMEGAATYRELASMENDKRRQSLLIKLAEAEERHAKKWSDQIVQLGGEDPSKREIAIPASRGVILTAKAAGLETALRRAESTEEEHVRQYESQARELGDEGIAAVLHELAEDESSHATTLRAMTGPAQQVQSRLESILKREKWHGKGGGWIGDAIYGVNDGLTAVFGIVSGVAAASSNNEFIVVAGLAGVLSSALSMGASAYLANKAEREVYEAELARESREIEENPEEEREELELFYQLKGFSEEESRTLVERMAEKPEQFLKALAHEELGLSEERLPNPNLAAVVGSVSTGLGGIVPVIPFFFLAGMTGIIVSLVVSIIAHFAVGASKSIVTLRSWWKSGLEMTGVALLVAVVAYAVGNALAIH
ncbi:MAG TPA: VIT1/CCC1 transporter family protein [Chloroflexota bacterium]|nr:VIT1/CCC1 transporter family protein [Chloroflexota bacterium]